MPPTQKERPDLYECDVCGVKGGSPSLCARCLAARAVAGSEWIGPWWCDPTYEQFRRMNSLVHTHDHLPDVEPLTLWDHLQITEGS